MCSYPFSIACTGQSFCSHQVLVRDVPGRMDTSPTAPVINTTSATMGQPTCTLALEGWCLLQTRGGAPGLNRPGCRSKDKFEFSCPEVGPSEHPRYKDPAGLQSIYPLIDLCFLRLSEVLCVHIPECPPQQLSRRLGFPPSHPCLGPPGGCRWSL